MSKKEVKAYEELLFTDDFMFCKVLENNEDLCKTSKNLPKRTRYYQGMIDLNLIEKGADYKELKKSYIIFICMQNPFQQNNLHLYTFENRCNEDVRLFLGDESTKVILTPEGNADDVSTELSDFLNYLAGKGGSSSFVKRLNAAVDKARNKEEWRMEYMTLLMRDREKFEQGLEQGLAQGLEQGRIDAVQRMLRKGYSKEDILALEYTEEEYSKAQANLLQMA